jgi:hypothetical protein
VWRKPGTVEPHGRDGVGKRLAMVAPGERRRPALGAALGAGGKVGNVECVEASATETQFGRGLADGGFHGRGSGAGDRAHTEPQRASGTDGGFHPTTTDARLRGSIPSAFDRTPSGIECPLPGFDRTTTAFFPFGKKGKFSSPAAPIGANTHAPVRVPRESGPREAAVTDLLRHPMEIALTLQLRFIRSQRRETIAARMVLAQTL